MSDNDSTRGSDYIIQVKVKNGPMLRAMRRWGFMTASSLSEATGVSVGTIGNFMNLQLVPITRTGDWRQPIIKIADVLKTMPQDLFPPQHIEKALEKNTGEVEASLAEVLTLAGHGASPEDKLLADGASEVISHALDSLTPREREIICRRYGLSGDPEQLEPIAQDLGVAKQRVHQLEAKALRKLRIRLANKRGELNIR